MRYYKIVITNPTTGAAITPSSLQGQLITSLNPDGSFNPSALNVELDLPIATSHAPKGDGLVRVWGLGIKDLGGAFDLNPAAGGKQGALVTVYGGMSAGLPLATSAQAGLLVKGQVYQAYGNWLGTEQTVDFILRPPQQGTTDVPANYTLNWKAGTQLSDALTTVLNAALPGVKQVMNISDRLTLAYDQPGYYGTLTQLSQFLNPLSKSIVTDAGYQGVTIAYDGTQVTVRFQDLLGQPTWIGPNRISVKLVMRGDIDLLTQVTLPPSIVSTQSGAFTGLTGNNPSNSLTFSGPYQVTSLHHYGNFRQPDAASWNTTLEMIKEP